MSQRKAPIALFLLVALAGCASRVQELPPLEASFEAEEETRALASAEVGLVTADPQTAAVLGPTLSLAFVPEGNESLPVREAPAIDAEVIDSLDRYTLDVPSTGRRQAVHGVTWVEVVTRTGLGWIDAQNVTEFVPSEDFCESSELTDYMLRELANSLHEDVPDRFAALLSPTHGLRVRYVRTDEPQHFTREWAASTMADGQPVEWGVDPASGEMVSGSFSERVGDELVPAIANGELSCNRLTTGVAPHVGDVPDSEVNLNFVSVHLPATDDLGMDWVTWTVGFTFEGGRPTIATLNRYVWEG
jgi:hypothetical protein